ncbi:MAG: hypothetical protein E6H64_08235, partial [Betaproteobacteria bacterium]
MGYEHRHQRDDDAQHDEQADQVAACVGASPLDEAHVVHEDQRADKVVPLIEGVLHDVQRPLLEPHNRLRFVGAHRRLAAERRRIRRRLITQLAGLVAESQRVQPLVLQRAREQRIDLARSSLFDQVGELLLHRVGDQLRADVEVAHPPAQREPIDQRHQRVGEEGERHHQRRDEPQR